MLPMRHPDILNNSIDFPVIHLAWSDSRTINHFWALRNCSVLPASIHKDRLASKRGIIDASTLIRLFGSHVKYDSKLNHPTVSHVDLISEDECELVDALGDVHALHEGFLVQKKLDSLKTSNQGILVESQSEKEPINSKTVQSQSLTAVANVSQGDMFPDIDEAEKKVRLWQAQMGFKLVVRTTRQTSKLLQCDCSGSHDPVMKVPNARMRQKMSKKTGCRLLFLLVMMALSKKSPIMIRAQVTTTRR